MKKYDFKFSSLLFFVFLSILIGTFLITMESNPNASAPISESMTTPTITSNNLPFELTDDQFQNYLKYINYSLSQKFNVEDIFINEDEYIEIIVPESLNETDIKFIISKLHSVSEIFLINWEDKITVKLQYNEGYEIVEIN